MDLKFQKTMLLAMRMNSAHRQDMRITPKLKVDLELFGKVNVFKILKFYDKMFIESVLTKNCLFFSPTLHIFF